MITLMLCFAILLILLCLGQTTRTFKENMVTYSRVTIQLSIGLLLIGSIFGQRWEVGSLSTKMQYKVGCGETINATIRINIGIRGFNIIVNTNSPVAGCLEDEVVDYDEVFDWNLGRSIQEQLARRKYMGTPKPIIWMLEYFTLHEDNFKSGLFYQITTRYCHICLWSAFAIYLGALIQFHIILRHGIICLTLSMGILILDGPRFEKRLCMMLGRDPLNNLDEAIYLSKPDETKMDKMDANYSKSEGDTENPDQDYFSIYQSKRTLYGLKV